MAERYVGTQSGGMDQAISVMGQRGLAKVVHFNPVRTDDVRLPAGAAFVIANSLTVSNKAETAHTRYNLRVVECRLAAMLMAKKLGKALAEALKFKTLGEVEKVVGGLEARAPRPGWGKSSGRSVRPPEDICASGCGRGRAACCCVAAPPRTSSSRARPDSHSLPAAGVRRGGEAAAQARGLLRRGAGGGV